MKRFGPLQLFLVAVLALAMAAAMLFTWLGLGSGNIRSKHGVHGSILAPPEPRG